MAKETYNGLVVTCGLKWNSYLECCSENQQWECLHAEDIVDQLTAQWLFIKQICFILIPMLKLSLHVQKINEFETILDQGSHGSRKSHEKKSLRIWKKLGNFGILSKVKKN